MYRPSKLITALFVFVCFAMNCYGQYGCLVNPSGSAGRSTVPRIYYTQQPGENNNPIRYFTNSFYYDVSCPAGSGPSTRYAINQGNTSTPSTQCFVEKKNDGSPLGYDNNYWQNGRLVNYTLANCPIDDYIPHLLIGSSLVGVFVLRRRV